MSTVYLVWVSDSRIVPRDRDYVYFVASAEDIAILTADNQMQMTHITCAWVVKWTVDVDTADKIYETIYQIGNGND